MPSETASEAIHLPTVAKIEVATDLMSLPEIYAKVYRVNDYFAVKIGYTVPLVVVERRGDRAGCPDFKITLIDYKSVRWYPEYSDFCNPTIASRFELAWLKLVPDILDHYLVELVMMQIVYASVYY